jgi:alanine racemase
MERPYSYTDLLWAEVDLGAIGDNVRQVKRWIGPDVELAAVVKANGYGHGSILVAREALRQGADRLAVAWLGEAVALRKAGIAGSILVMGYVWPGDAPTIVHHGLTPTVNSLELATALSDASVALGQVTQFHVKMDTGMSRYGLMPHEALSFIHQVVALPGLSLEGVWTHFATADEADTQMVHQQLAQYHELLADLERAGIPVAVRHAANSGATMRLPEAHLDMVRCGILIYGLYPSHDVEKRISLRPALSLKARLARVRTLPAGTGISYGHTYITPREMPVGLVPVGYGDGYHRLMSSRGAVLVGGCRAPILGRVCMDTCVVDLTDVPDPREGDEVVIIGQQGNDAILAEEVASWADTVNYEVLTGLTSRLPRVFRTPDDGR